MILDDIKRAIDRLSNQELEELKEYIMQKQAGSQNTKVGIIGDLHGDYDSFKKALAFFDRQGITQILCAGDIVDRGSNADQIIQIIQERDILCIAGNHDRTIVKNQARWRQHKNPQKMRQLGRIVSDESIEFLDHLPDTAEILIEGIRIFVAHGTPWSDVMTAFPDSRQSTFERIYQEYAENCDLIILGHTHHPMDVNIKGLRIINAGSVYSVTMRDSNTFGILSLPDCSFTVYDIQSGNPPELSIIKL